MTRSASGPTRRAWRHILLLLTWACVAGLAGVATRRAVAAESPRLGKITFSTAAGVTRLTFHASDPLRPTIARPQELVLRVDLATARCGETPDRLQVKSSEVARVTRLPESLRFLLPEGVSERYLIQLAASDVGWRLVEEPTGFTLLIGDEVKIGGGTTWLGEPSGWHAERLLDEPPVRSPDVVSETQPALEEYFAVVAGIRLPAEQAVRAGPSALHPAIGLVREGTTLPADARRGDWVHVATGGWVVSPAGTNPMVETRTAQAPQVLHRTPVVFTLLTLGTGIAVDVTEYAAGVDAESDAVLALFREQPGVARLDVRMTGPPSVIAVLPPKADRLVLELSDGRKVGSLDPATLPRAPGVSQSRLDALFAAPRLGSGDVWTGWLVLPRDLDFTLVDKASVDLDGRLHPMFKVPGSGELVEAGPQLAGSAAGPPAGSR